MADFPVEPNDPRSSDWYDKEKDVDKCYISMQKGTNYCPHLHAMEGGLSKMISLHLLGTCQPWSEILC